MESTAIPPVRLAIIGSGGISGEHAKGILANPGLAECVALCDVSDENLRQRNAQLGGGCRLFHDWQTMFAEMGDGLDAVDICLPHHLHAPAIIDAARARKDVLCEKPLCTTLAEADHLVEVVRETGILYQSAHNQLFMPCVAEAKRRIVAGEVGEVRWLRSQDCFINPVAALKDKWRASLKTQGGGELIDTGYHPTYRLLHLAGSEVVGVRASMARFTQPIEGEDTASVQVRFASGAIGEILTSWSMNNPHGSHQIHVAGSRAQLWGSNHTLWVLPNGEHQPQQIDLEPVATIPTQMGDFVRRVRSRERPLHSVEEGRLVLDVILRATADAEGWQALAKPY